jgi:hypothetical protein
MRKLKGMTIVEVLVYFALFGVIFISIIEFMISIRATNTIAVQRNELEKNSIFVMNHFNSNFDKTNSINVGSSVFNNDNGKIVLNLSGGTVEYSLVNGVLHYLENGTDYVLTNTDFTLSKFYLEQVLNSQNQLVGVRFNITFQSSKNPSTKYNFQTSMLFK